MNDVIKGAVISSCGAFRYRLWRIWGDGPRVAFVMLNPSTADADLDDPTIRKCLGFAKRWGFEGLEVVNLFAYRATDPADLKRAGFPVGPYNDASIRAACSGESVMTTVCAWGANAAGHPRAADVYRLLLGIREPEALQINRDGTPAHPLMLPYSSPRKWFEWTSARFGTTIPHV